MIILFDAFKYYNYGLQQEKVDKFPEHWDIFKVKGGSKSKTILAITV